MPTQELARTGLKALKLGIEVAEPLARVFEDTADRMDLYENYADAFAEMSRRLEPILPDDAAQRNRWIHWLFEPLTGRVVEVMRNEGLDFRSPESQTVPLSRKSEGHTGRPIPFDRRGTPIRGGVPMSAARPDAKARASARRPGISRGSTRKARR